MLAPAAAVLLAVLAGFLLPDTCRVERSAVIHAPPERIYPMVASPRRWQKRSMPNRREPAMAMTFFGPESGDRAGWSRDSKSEGKGRMAFLAADPPPT